MFDVLQPIKILVKIVQPKPGAALTCIAIIWIKLAHKNCVGVTASLCVGVKKM